MRPVANRYRAGCALIAAVSLVAATLLVIRGSSRPVFLNQSLASGAAVLLAATVAGLATAASLSSALAWARWLRAFEDWQSTPTHAGTIRQFLLILVLGVCCQGAVTWRLAAANERAVDDQADYLRAAREVVQLGGLHELPGALCRGEFREDNRNPLYVALLALRPTFECGKRLSIGFGLLVTIVTAVITLQMAGPSSGCLAVALMAANAALLHSAALVACETLLVLITLVAWWRLARGDWHSPLEAAAVGGIFGLAYLTKASAFLLFLLTCGSVPFRNSRPVRRRLVTIALMLGGFALLAGPLLVRNARVFCNPLHSFNNRLVFADSYDQGTSQPDLGVWGNWQRYRANHSWLQIADRLVRGLTMETFVFLRVFGSIPLDSGRAIVGVFVIAFALFGLFNGKEQRPIAWLVLLWAFCFWLFFGWYQPIATSDRFVLPLVPIFAAAAARALSRSLCWLVGHAAAGRLAGIIAAAYLTVTAGFTMIG
jgi:hypothetical protein